MLPIISLTYLIIVRLKALARKKMTAIKAVVYLPKRTNSLVVPDIKGRGVVVTFNYTLQFEMYNVKHTRESFSKGITKFL